MRFYISAKWHLKEDVAVMNSYLIQKGHKITADWTKRAFARFYEVDIGQSDRFSQEEALAILESDVFVHISDLGGKGKYVDLGVAIAGNILRGHPKIYVIGNPANESQFYFNRAVNRIVSKNYLESLDEILCRESLKNGCNHK